MKMKVVQCWDDCTTNDIRLCTLLRKHNAKATFNVNAGLHRKENKNGWTTRDGLHIERLDWDIMPELYDGFTIASHGLTHQHMEKLPPDRLRHEIVHGRAQLQRHFKQDIPGFAYPFGGYNDTVKQALRDAGHLYARTCHNVDFPFPPADPMEFHPTCHFLAPDFWQRYEKARADTAHPHSVFYFWGHSYELTTEPLWTAFDTLLHRIASDPSATWADLPTLFQ